MGMITKEDEAKFRYLQQVCLEGRLCLTRCTDKVTRKDVMVIAEVVAFEGENYEIIHTLPLARFFDGDPMLSVEVPFDEPTPDDPARKEMN